MADEQFRRTEIMLGPEGLQRLREALVVVVGLGAVGGYAVEALARAGVGHLRLVDHDTVKASNLNRQLLALHSALGQPKVELAAARVRDINPECRVEALRLFCHADTLGQILAGPPDLVLDAIDSFNPKLELLVTTVQRGLPVVSSMGAALRTDPSRVRVGLLTEATDCPLARRLRKFLRRREVTTDLPCVYSDEPVETRFVQPPEARGAEEQGFNAGRPRRSLASLPTLTGIFGLTMANEALRLLLGNLWPEPRPR
jgi:tRNA A37 threonylcarbamoyladenosine dehydratase